MTTEELHGQVARAAAVERELRDRIRDMEEKIARAADKVQRAEADRDHAQMRWREAKEENTRLRRLVLAALHALAHDTRARRGGGLMLAHAPEVEVPAALETWPEAQGEGEWVKFACGELRSESVPRQEPAP